MYSAETALRSILSNEPKTLGNEPRRGRQIRRSGQAVFKRRKTAARDASRRKACTTANLILARRFWRRGREREG